MIKMTAVGVTPGSTKRSRTMGPTFESLEDEIFSPEESERERERERNF